MTQTKPEVHGWTARPITKQFRSSSPHRRERARKSALAGQSTDAATRDLIPLFRDRPQPVADQGQSALRRSEGDQRRVVIVVVGATPHRGDGSTDYRAKDHREY